MQNISLMVLKHTRHGRLKLPMRYAIQETLAGAGWHVRSILKRVITMADNYKYSSNGQYKGFVINANGPKPEPRRTKLEISAIRERRRKLNEIDDREFEKKLGIFGEKY